MKIFVVQQNPDVDTPTGRLRPWAVCKRQSSMSELDDLEVVAIYKKLGEAEKMAKALNKDKVLNGEK